MTDLGEIGLTHRQFLARIPAEARPAGAGDRYQIDYALTRLVARNCAAVGEHASQDNPTDLVVKGGFAIRHLYAGVRYSKDADLAMATDELELEGPRLMVWPSDMNAIEHVNEGLTSWRLEVRFLTTDRRIKRTQVDLNDRSRALRRRPPQQRPLIGLFMDPLPVWAATTEEIVGEKLCALLDQPDIRIKDIFDIRHVLGLAHEPINALETRKVYLGVRQTKGKHVPDLGGILAAIRAASSTARAGQQWQADVIDFVVDAPSISTATNEMIELLQERVLRE